MTGTQTRRSVLGLLGAAGGALAIPGTAHADRGGRIPRDVLPGGAYDRFLAELAARDEISGTVLLAHRGRHVLARSFGMADKERSIPNALDTVFPLASASKPFTGLAICQLVQRGKLGFHEKLGTYLDGFPAEIADGVTVHHLLTHTNGIDDYGHTREYRENFHTWTSAAEVSENTLNLIRRMPLLFTPGSRSAYSNSGLVLLGEIVAKVSGRSFYDYVREHIFAPAGMSRSDYYTRPRWLSDPTFAHPYLRNAAGRRVDALHEPPVVKVQVPPGFPGRDENGFGQVPNAAHMFIGNGAGNGFTTAGDLVRFERALTGGRLLDPAHTELYVSGKIPGPPWRPTEPVRNTFMAYTLAASMFNNCRVIGHGGGAAGESTNWSIYRDLEWTGVILCNYDLDVETIINRERRAVTDHRVR